MDNETSTTLEKARALIADPRHWQQGVLARNQNGVSAHVLSDSACSFCALGALMRAVGTGSIVAVGLSRPGRILDKVVIGGLVPGVALLNDSPTTKHADILALFDKAIAKAKGTR